MNTVQIQQEDDTAILKNHPEKTKNIVTAVMQEREGQREIVASATLK